MDYELAKKLEAAGFPIRPSRGVTEDGEPVETIMLPTLEELIEACGERFTALRKIGDQWETEADAPNSWGKYGTTPTEAVARLWLALNKK